MQRSLNLINLVLLLGLGALCLVQWHKEDIYGKRLTELQHTADAQGDKLAEQNDTIKRATEDLEDFKGQVAAQKTRTDEQVEEIRGLKARAFSFEQDKEKAERQSGAWQQAIEEYKKAVANRDDNIRILLEQRDTLHKASEDAALKVNQTIVAYNDLRAKYDDVVTRFNDLAAVYNSEHKAAQKDGGK
jgi:chromosome segregation ATPase